MIKHVDGGSAPSQARHAGGGDVLDGNHRTSELLKIYDATPLIGLCTIVHNGAIRHVDEQGEESIEIPKMRELAASAAVARCLMPVRLRGAEMKAMRKIMGMTIQDLAKNLDERTAPETISRWETEAQAMGGYVEKLLRLLVCETLCEAAPGVPYEAKKIAYLKVLDPWRGREAFEVPAVEFSLVRLREKEGAPLIDAWDLKMAA
jgi:DNA-binding transcriptional regulator YiaG